MTAQPDNVRPLRPTRATEALAEARAIPPGELDRILTDEAAKPTDPNADDWRELLASGDAIAITDHVWPRGVIRGLIDERDAAIRERDRLRAIAVVLEQQTAEVERTAAQWTKLHDGVKAGMGNVLLDILRSERGDHPAA